MSAVALKLAVPARRARERDTVALSHNAKLLVIWRSAVVGRVRGGWSGLVLRRHIEKSLARLETSQIIGRYKPMLQGEGLLLPLQTSLMVLQAVGDRVRVKCAPTTATTQLLSKNGYQSEQAPEVWPGFPLWRNSALIVGDSFKNPIA